MMKRTGMVPCAKQTGSDYFGTSAAKGRFVDSLFDIAEFFTALGRVPAIKDKAAYAAFINPAFLERVAGR